MIFIILILSIKLIYIQFNIENIAIYLLKFYIK